MSQHHIGFVKIPEDQRNLQQPTTETKKKDSYRKKEDGLRLAHSVKQSLGQTIKKPRVLLQEIIAHHLKVDVVGLPSKAFEGHLDKY